MICTFKEDESYSTSNILNQKGEIPIEKINIANLSQNEKDEILVSFEKSQDERFEPLIQSIRIIAFENICQRINIELSMNALLHAKHNTSCTFLPEINETLLEQILYFINQFLETNSIPNLLNMLSILIFIIEDSTNTMIEQHIITFIIQSQFLNSLMLFDLQRLEVSKLIWILFKKSQKYTEKVPIEKVLIDTFFKNGIDALHHFLSIEFNPLIAEIQNYLFKSISILPLNRDDDLNFIDLCTQYLLSSQQNIKVKTLSIKAVHQKSCKSIQLFNLILDLILQLKTIDGNERLNDKFLIAGLEYLNFSYNCCFANSLNNKPILDTPANHQKILNLFLYVLENKSFEIANIAIKLLDQIMTDTHQIDLNIIKALIEHIDATPIGSICLIHSFLSLDSLSPEDLIHAISYYYENIENLVNFVESDYCEMTYYFMIDHIFQVIDEIFNDQ